MGIARVDYLLEEPIMEDTNPSQAGASAWLFPGKDAQSPHFTHCRTVVPLAEASVPVILHGNLCRVQGVCPVPGTYQPGAVGWTQPSCDVNLMDLKSHPRSLSWLWELGNHPLYQSLNFTLCKMQPTNPVSPGWTESEPFWKRQCTGCYGHDYVPPNPYVEALTPRASE